MCAREEEKKWKLRREEYARRITEVEFQAYGRCLVAMSEFNYLGQVLTALDEEWEEVVENLRNVRKQWESMLRIIGREGADPRTPEKFYKAVVQTTLLLGSESWVMFPSIGRTLGGFHRRVSCHMENAAE